MAKKDRVSVAVVRVDGEDPRVVTLWVDRTNPDDSGMSIIKALQQKRARGRIHSVTLLPDAPAHQPAPKPRKAAKATEPPAE